MVAFAAALFGGLHVAAALRTAVHDGPKYKLNEVKTGALVPHCLLDSHHVRGSGARTLKECKEKCESTSECIGFQFGAKDKSPCIHRASHVMKTSKADTCAAHYRALAQDRGFGDIPLVPVTKDDGVIYMREDCMDNIPVRGNTYWGIPWDWNQPGLSLMSKTGYGVSPLLDLVTHDVLRDLIESGIPPWRARPMERNKVVDVQCTDSHDPKAWKPIIDMLKSGRRGRDGRALVVDVGKCICPMLSNGWDPTSELKTDAVLLMHRDENFSPASPFINTARFAWLNTKTPCVKWRGNTSKFENDEDAFNAMAKNKHVLGMYFMQTPPITHDKVFLVPLGVDMSQWVDFIKPHVVPGAPGRNLSRTALYEVSHNLAVDYRREVFKVVQENFGKEPLHQRHLTWATGPRMREVAEESLQAVFGESPIGIGENCFRHGELLLAGVIPVVQGSLGVASMRYLPHLAVSNWHEVTPEMLRKAYQPIWDRVKNGEFSFEPLTRRFWREHIEDVANKRPIDEFYAKFPNPPVTCDHWRCL